MRPRTPQLVELHVFYVPEEVWNFQLNTVPVALSNKFISAGFIRVSPHITLRVLREKLGEYLGGAAVADKFKFLKCIGKKLAVLENQEGHSSVEWGEKEPVSVLHTKHEQDRNNRIQEKQIQFREKDQNRCLFTASNSNPADWESGKSDTVSQSSQQSHLRQDPKENPAPKQSDRAKGTTLTLRVNRSAEQGQNIQTLQNHIKNQNELMNVEISDHQKDTKLRRGRTEDAGILNVMEDQTTEYVYKQQSLWQYRTSKCVADPGEKLDNQADENKQNNLLCPKEYISPPSPPFWAPSVNPTQVPSIQAAKNKMLEQLQEMKKDRRHMEKTREELIKKAKGLLEQNRLRRYHGGIQVERKAREEWKKKYFETKKATVSLEEALNKLQQDVELYHQKLLMQLEARDSRKRPNNMTNSKNYNIIQITTVQHELDQLRRKLDDTKMKLVIEIKMRKQAASDLRALRAELTHKKIHAALVLRSRESGI
ncbi:spermatogenesis-associated protein 1 isoform B [Patagioenas fasciata monilis]|uniref:Spermatogenesis-associated protein 1 isoform B n=1 Tax=Patagioenas fasciata monilis TaxID=372326 RepID=A0A1V4JZ39_PATFA|nr:spermatogenesis-associated protein 1 isoform B [Patagioenas fasciata monilis]